MSGCIIYVESKLVYVERKLIFLHGNSLREAV